MLSPSTPEGIATVASAPQYWGPATAADVGLFCISKASGMFKVLSCLVRLLEVARGPRNLDAKEDRGIPTSR
jgi:hypothetical protein